MVIKTKGEKVFDVINIFIMIILSAMFIIPALMIIFASFTSSTAFTLNGYSLWISDFSLEYYLVIFKMESNQFLVSFGNSLFIVVTTVALQVVTTCLGAYAIIRKQLQFKAFFHAYFLVPILFSGGTIAGYLLIYNLGLLNTHWAIILPGSVSAWYILMVKNFFTTVPESLIEAAELEGANNVQILITVVVPLGLPIIATIVLYTSVGIWNDWYAASVYIVDETKWPLQTFIRNVQDSDAFLKAYFGGDSIKENFDGIRGACVILSLIPIICVYPFLQRFFIEGTIVGSVKE